MMLLNTPGKVLQVLSPAGRRRAFLVFLAMVVSGGAEVLGIAAMFPFAAAAVNPEPMTSWDPWLTRLYDLGGFTDSQTFVASLAVAVGLLFVVSNACSAATLWLCYRFSFDENHRLGQRLLEEYLGRPYVWYLQHNTADLTKIVVTEVTEMMEQVVLRIMVFTAKGVVALFISVGLLWLSPAVALSTAAVLAIFYALVYGHFRDRLKRIGQQRMDAQTARFRAVSEALSSVKETMIPPRLGHFAEIHRRYSRTVNDLTAANYLMADLPRHMMEITAFSVILAVIAYVRVTQGSASAAMPLVGLYVMAMLRLMPALQHMYAEAVRIRFHLPVLHRLHKELMQPRARGEDLEVHERLEIRDSIRIEDVSFRYPGCDEDAVRGVTLELPRNTSTALVGLTGSGKTTLAGLVAGLLRPQRGTIEVDGQPLWPERTRAWQNNLGYVPQHIHLLDDTVLNNIAFGIPEEEVDHAAVVRAARMANIHDFVGEELTRGYDTVLGERGITLSGGQRQRLGIARALYHEPEVLIFDEATSALDSLTERVVMEAIQQLSHRKTLLVVAHRLSTVKACDCICLVEEGRLKSQGSFPELMRTCPEFQALAQSNLAPPRESDLCPESGAR